MYNIAVFPGQGSQRKDMAMDFTSQFKEARQVFEAASDALSFDVAAVCMNDENILNQTEFAQPCILTAEIAMFRALQAAYNWNPEYFGGHSLGEYTALVAAGVIPFEQAVKLVRQRGLLMQGASPQGVGGMAAVIMEPLPLEKIEELTQAYEIDIANDNSANQVVLSGEKNVLQSLCDALIARFKDQSLRTVSLDVSAPFHSRYMSGIAQSFKALLEKSQTSFDISNLNRVTSNVTGQFHPPKLDSLIDLLTRQLNGRVRWRENMTVLHSKASSILEIGPNKPLGGFFRSLGFAASSIIDLRSAKRIFETPAVSS